MIPKRELSSLGMMRWDDLPAAVLDHRLTSVLLENITARLSVIDRHHACCPSGRSRQGELTASWQIHEVAIEADQVSATLSLRSGPVRCRAARTLACASS